MCHLQLCLLERCFEANIPLYSTVLFAMAGGGPVPVPTSDPDEKVLSIADLEKAASKKLGKIARGNFGVFIMPDFRFLMMLNRHGSCLR